jgi:CheY-like chemotaxis protein
MDKTLTLLEDRAREKNLNLSWQVDEEVPDLLLGDPNRLSQVITNLVANAIKFTDQGEVEVKVIVKERDGDTVLLHFSVRDTGIGIPADKQKIIFESFSQAYDSHARKYGGTGLGLAISYHLSNIMGGTMWVESDCPPSRKENDTLPLKPFGTTFHFTIPFNIFESEGHLKKSLSTLVSPPEFDGKGMKVLLADDDLTNRTLVIEILKEHDVLVTEVTNGQEAVEVFEENEFDLVLMDVNMPEMDGFEATAAIRKIEKRTGNKISIIALTAHAIAGYREKCLAGGMNDYISKPIDSNELLDCLDRIQKNWH